MTRMFDVREPSIAALREAPVYFRYGSNKRRVLVDGLTGQAVLVVYDALKSEEQRAKFERMIQTQAGLYKIVDFAWKMVSIA